MEDFLIPSSAAPSAPRKRLQTRSGVPSEFFTLRNQLRAAAAVAAADQLLGAVNMPVQMLLYGRDMRAHAPLTPKPNSSPGVWFDVRRIKRGAEITAR